jgi:hypothetical protein
VSVSVCVCFVCMIQEGRPRERGAAAMRRVRRIYSVFAAGAARRHGCR